MNLLIVLLFLEISDRFMSSSSFKVTRSRFFTAHQHEDE